MLIYKPHLMPHVQEKRVFDVHPDGLQSAGSATTQNLAFHGDVSVCLSARALSAYQVELNFDFLIHLYASFGGIGLPPVNVWKDYQYCDRTTLFSDINNAQHCTHSWQDIYKRLATRFGLFAPKTTKKTIKATWFVVLFQG